MLTLPVFLSLLNLTLACAISTTTSTPNRQRCKSTDPCWPSPSTWHAFNTSISGRLLPTHPSASSCHTLHYNAHLCAIARANWTVSDWRTSQPGAYTALLWEFGPTEQCYIDSPIDAPCQQGYVPSYSVNASSVSDIQAAVRFADQNDVYLVIKNTGHDHLGRSSGGGGLSIWTHHLKGMEWEEGFKPQNAPWDTVGVSAVTVQAGEQWVDVYDAAAEQKRIVVGGHARTVGAAGGWLTGGGHSVWSNLYGLGIDNVLEVHVVRADGEHVTLNEYTNRDHFWAIRGGGGCAFGVITSVTYRTHPEPEHVQVVLVQVNASSEEVVRDVVAGSLKALDPLTAAGYTGYGYITRWNDSTSAYPPGFGGIFIQPNGNNETFRAGTSAFVDLNSDPNVSAFAFPLPLYPTWQAYTKDWLTDQNIAQNVIDASRLLTPNILSNETALSSLTDLILTHGGGLNYIGRVNPSIDHSTSAIHPSWSHSLAVLSLGENWVDPAPQAEKDMKRQNVVELSNRLTEIFGPKAGTYINEANPFEPRWKEVFWGMENYERLLEIKERIDPGNLFVCNRCVGGDIEFEA